MSNSVIVANTEILIEILRSINELHDSIAEIKKNTEQLAVDIQGIKNEVNEKISQDTEECKEIEQTTAFDY